MLCDQILLCFSFAQSRRVFAGFGLREFLKLYKNQKKSIEFRNRKKKKYIESVVRVGFSSVVNAFSECFSWRALRRTPFRAGRFPPRFRTTRNILYRRRKQLHFAKWNLPLDVRRARRFPRNANAPTLNIERVAYYYLTRAFGVFYFPQKNCTKRHVYIYIVSSTRPAQLVSAELRTIVIVNNGNVSTLLNCVRGAVSYRVLRDRIYERDGTRANRTNE